MSFHNVTNQSEANIAPFAVAPNMDNYFSAWAPNIHNGAPYGPVVKKSLFSKPKLEVSRLKSENERRMFESALGMFGWF